MRQTATGKPTDGQQSRYRHSLEAFLRAMGDAPARANLLAATVRHVKPSLQQRRLAANEVPSPRR
jgi:hypothetical protein